MLDEPHDLLHELPEYGDQILALCESDADFRQLLVDYDTLDGRIQDIELAGIPVDDVYAERLKKRRLALKDALFERLNAMAMA